MFHRYFSKKDVEDLLEKIEGLEKHLDEKLFIYDLAMGGATGLLVLGTGALINKIGIIFLGGVLISKTALIGIALICGSIVLYPMYKGLKKWSSYRKVYEHIEIINPILRYFVND